MNKKFGKTAVSGVALYDNSLIQFFRICRIKHNNIRVNESHNLKISPPQ